MIRTFDPTKRNFFKTVILPLISLQELLQTLFWTRSVASINDSEAIFDPRIPQKQKTKPLHYNKINCIPA